MPETKSEFVKRVEEMTGLCWTAISEYREPDDHGFNGVIVAKNGGDYVMSEHPYNDWERDEPYSYDQVWIVIQDWDEWDALVECAD